MRALVAVIAVAVSAVVGYVAWDASRQTDSTNRLALSEPVALSPAPQASPAPEPSPAPEEQAIQQEQTILQSEPAVADTPAAVAVVDPAPSPTPDTRADVPAEAPAALQPEVTTAPAQPTPRAVEESVAVAATPPAAPQTPSLEPAAVPQTPPLEPAAVPQTPPLEPAAAPRAQPSESTVAAVAPTEPPAAAPAPEAVERVAEETPVAPPTFDVVRVTPKGTAVIAGRAEPGSKVVVSDAENVIGEATADARGEWVVVPEAPLEPGTAELGLVQRTIEGTTVESESVVVLAVPERKVEAPEPKTEAATEEAEAATEEAESPGVIAVLVPREGGGASEVLQEPSAGIGIKGPEKLSLDTIDYDDKGNVALSGRGGESNEIVVYLDDKFIGRDKVDPDSGWSVAPEQALPPGLYRLRVDQVDPTGKVVARIETPFASADFTLPKGDAGVVVVQPGNSLWRIARRMYGGGLQYVVIYEANRDQIIDPDLIYPGQIFVMPEAN